MTRRALTALATLGDQLPARWRTRFAPAPTGWLHLGHAVSALYVWGIARAFGGRVLLRVEDHDAVRSRIEYERALFEDLAWLGFEPDELAPPQRDRGAAYEAALSALEDGGLAYPCACSRRDIADASGDVFNAETRYPGTCRTRALDPQTHRARRVRMDDGVETFDDLLLGPQSQPPAVQCGDVLARDRDGRWTYQFAVAIDDRDQRIDLVIRGEDLLASTGRQLRLAHLVGRAVPPRFLHHPLVHLPSGAKLSKSAGDTGLRELRAAGRTAAEVLGMAAQAAGLVSDGRPVRANEVAALFRA